MKQSPCKGVLMSQGAAMFAKWKRVRAFFARVSTRKNAPSSQF
jgi:hypothetical protein